MAAVSLLFDRLKKNAGEPNPDSLTRARLKIFCFVLAMNMVQIVALMPEHFRTGSFLIGDIIRLLISTAFIIALLVFPKKLNGIIHSAIIISTVGLFLRVYFAQYGMSVLTAQHVFMVMILSFYGISRKWGLVYSTAAALILVLYVLIHIDQTKTFLFFPEPFTLLGNVTGLIVSFIVIIYANYNYHHAFENTLEEKKVLNQQLNNLVSAKSTFLSTMSHELRTPLNSVIGMSNLLIESKHSPDQAENLNALKFSAETLLTLINDILDFNKIDSGKIELEKIPFNLAAVVENSCASLRSKAVEKGLVFDLAFDPKIRDFKMLGDPGRLTQILLNLIGNAIKFTREGSVEVNLNLLELDKTTAKVRFSVADTGIGISGDKQDQIFEPFTQASTSTTRKFGGTGLGLAIVKYLIHLHGSIINLRSEPGQGTVFYFDITYPICEENEGSVKPSVSSEIVSRDLAGLNVLVAEDNTMNIFFMKKLLLSWKANAIFAENGEITIGQLEANEVDVILMDIHMPVMGGFEATGHIRQMTDKTKSTVPIIALTASVTEGIYEKIKLYGLNDYVLKPFQPDDLYRKLAHIATKKK